jgi:hypothetical protein
MESFGVGTNLIVRRWWHMADVLKMLKAQGFNFEEQRYRGTEKGGFLRVRPLR